MDVYILRHGKAAPPSLRIPSDHDRPLTDAGLRELSRTGRALRHMGIRPDTLASSPLLRAIQTAEAISKYVGAEVEIWEDLKPETIPDETLHTIRSTGADSIMLVGHEPHLTGLISHMTSGRPVQISLKKGGLACVRLPVLGYGALRYILTPKQMGMMS